MGCALKEIMREKSGRQEKVEWLEKEVTDFKKKEVDATFPFIKEIVEDVVRHFCKLGRVNEGYENNSFAELFPECKRKVAAMNCETRGKDKVREEHVDDDEEEDKEEEGEEEG
ncbi:hypothetical protein KSP39_PZI022284 [Platanthera zijinensis]|uniref:Uncharacterized protein n=1 Tax=Platanthera zijinensis TaxID=2320716 RepID=A0AAP0AW43_9ASPA